MAERFSEEVKKDLNPVEYHEWEGIKVGTIISIKDEGGMFRVLELTPDRGVAMVQEVNEQGEPLHGPFDAELEKLTKDIA